MATKSKSGIKIKPQNKGKFTALAKSRGQSVQQAARSILADKDSPAEQRKEANFARNATKFKHKGKKK